MRRTFLCGFALLLIALLIPAIGRCGETPIGRGNQGIGGFHIVPTSSVAASMEESSDGGRKTLRVRFDKKGNDRRILILETPRAAIPEKAQSMGVRCAVDMKTGEPPKIAFVVFEKGGGVWYRVNVSPVPSKHAEPIVMPLNLHEASFSKDDNGKFDRDRARKAWIGFLFDTPASGVITINDAFFSTERYKPTHPILVPVRNAQAWNLAKDPAVHCELTTPGEGPRGERCMKVAFHFPPGRHMFLLPTITLPAMPLDGYNALRFTYKTILPKGIDALLIELRESGGGAYYAKPPRSKTWRTITIPFKDFRLGGWSHDADKRLDLDLVRTADFGTHGTTTDPTGNGVIYVTDIQFVP